jgi:hypothetical protein
MHVTDHPQPSVRGRESSAQNADGKGSIQIDPAANAALAEAIMSAEKASKTPAAPAVDLSSAVETPQAERRSGLRILQQGTMAAALIGAGWFASYMGTLANHEVIHRLETETARSQEILTRLSGDLDALKGSLAAYKDVEQTASTASASDQGKLAEKVERLAVAVQAPDPKITALEAKLDRMEGQITATLAGLPAKPAAAPAPTLAPTEAAIRTEAPPVKDPKDEPVEGWVLREVYNGAALIEGRNRRLYEVMPGGTIPGVGRVASIERRGRSWVVQTDRGYISAYYR